MAGGEGPGVKRVGIEGVGVKLRGWVSLSFLNAYINAMTPQKLQPSKKLAPRNAERLRLGLTGLAAIFLLVMVVAAGLRPFGHPAPQDPKGESLAVLGVAPGAGPSEPTPPKP